MLNDLSHPPKRGIIGRTAKMQPRIGFVGVGLMGHGMARIW